MTPIPLLDGTFATPSYDSLAYDFQATGEYVAATDPTDGFEIQSCTSM